MFTGVLSLSPPPPPPSPTLPRFLGVHLNSLPTYRRALLSERLEQANLLHAVHGRILSCSIPPLAFHIFFCGPASSSSSPEDPWFTSYNRWEHTLPNARYCRNGFVLACLTKACRSRCCWTIRFLSRQFVYIYRPFHQSPISVQGWRESGTHGGGGTTPDLLPVDQTPHRTLTRVPSTNLLTIM